MARKNEDRLIHEINSGEHVMDVGAISERRLIAAVVQRAVEDAVCRISINRTHKKKARKWFYFYYDPLEIEVRKPEPLSFLWCMQSLDLEWREFREHLMEIIYERELENFDGEAGSQNYRKDRPKS